MPISIRSMSSNSLVSSGSTGSGGADKTCEGCGVRTHKSKKFGVKPVTNAFVYEGICMKCNPENVPEDVRDALQCYYVKQENKAQESAAKAEAKKLAKSSSSVSSDEDAGTCEGCGVRTHKSTKFGTKPVTNAFVYDGTCMACRPQDVPPEVRDALQGYYTKQEKKAEKSAAKAEAKKQAKALSRSSSSVVSDSDDKTCEGCGVLTHKAKKFGTKPVTNAMVYEGTCMKCQPDKVPQDVREALQGYYAKQEEKANAKANKVSRSSSTSNLTKPVEAPPANESPVKGEITADQGSVSTCTEMETSFEDSVAVKVEDNSVVTENTDDTCEPADPVDDAADPVDEPVVTEGRRTSKYVAGAAVVAAGAAAALMFVSDGTSSKGSSLRRTQTRAV